MLTVVLDSPLMLVLPLRQLCAAKVADMSPTVLKIGPYRFFFNSREETRVHVHVASGGGTAKFWLEPIVALADSHGLNVRELREIQGLVEEYKDEFTAAWHRHFAL